MCTDCSLPPPQRRRQQQQKIQKSHACLVSFFLYTKIMQRRLQVLSNHLLLSKPLQLLSSHGKSHTQQQQQQGEHAPLPIKTHPLVRAALDKHGQKNNVVALESTIITHGMPFPENVQTARKVEAQIRKYGAIPATIAILDGIIHVGLTDDQLDRLGQLGPQNVHKCSRRDLSVVCARGEHGATTVSATMIIAHMVGIRVFVTGGIGGVHRGFNETMDVSSDLTELGRTPVTVVSAGVKSILDIPRTLEFLETEGVTVASYQTDEFPAFFTSKSGMKAHCRMDSPEEIARVIDMNTRMNLNSGILIAVPIPEHEEAKASKINSAIDEALRESVEKGISGKDITPFLLERINEITGGESLRANIALVLNNAKVGAQIASVLPLIP
jgi:pseudouridine-5'-phosphate glycosidase